MSELTVGITGGTGFVGGRLAERLVLANAQIDSDPVSVVATVRRFSGAGLARLARLPVRLVEADLLDEEAIGEAFADCDVVVHCAYGTGGPMEQRRKVTVEGTRNVLRAAAAADARRVVHMSTAAVHRTDGQEVDEETPVVSRGSFYEEMKLEAEELVWEAHRDSGVPGVVLRPTLIYGPWGRRWTARIAEEVREGAVLPEGASTTSADLVYVDNVVDAILRSATEESAVGEAFVLVDDDPPTWREVYARYARILPDAPPVKEMSVRQIRAERRRREPGFVRGSFVEPFRVLPQVIRAAVRPQPIRDRLWKIPWLAGPARLVPESVKARIKGESDGDEASTSGGEQRPEYPLPDPKMVDLYTSETRYRNEKAGRLLGDWQRIDFDEGMERTAAWLRYRRIAPGATSGESG